MNARVLRTRHLAAALVAGLVACSGEPRRAIILVPHTDRIEGWLDARGELSVFPDKLSWGYDPYGPNEDDHCVTVVTESPEVRGAAVALSGKRVRVWGRAIAYDDLDQGADVGDKLLSKRYYQNTPVENACLRKYIFVGHHFEAA